MRVAGLKAECNFKLYVILSRTLPNIYRHTFLVTAVNRYSGDSPHSGCPQVQLALQVAEVQLRWMLTGVWSVNFQPGLLTPHPSLRERTTLGPRAVLEVLTPTGNQTADRPARTLVTIRTPSLEIRSTIWVGTGPSCSHISWDVACRFEDRTHKACRMHGRYTFMC
jgi:hypothetical protein